MDLLAYRLVPCDDDGRAQENSQYMTLTSERLGVGSRIEAALFGHGMWEVIDVREETRALIGAKDQFGNDIPLAGTLICRGVS